MITMTPTQLQRKNSSTKIKWARLGVLCLALILPATVCAQQIQQGGTESMYQESYQQEINTPYQQESFQQNQLSYGIPSSRRPTFNNFYGAEERAYRSREEMRRDEEYELQRELMESELKQRQLDLKNQQQASGIQGYGQGGGSPFGGFVQPGPPIIVDNQNNTQVIIKLGKDENGNPIVEGGSSQGPIQSDVTVVQEGSGNNTSVDIQK
jgi:hypothetical protein